MAPTEWTNLSLAVGPPPPFRESNSMVWDPVDQCVLLFGGDGPNGFLGDTWQFSHDRWSRIVTAHAPSARWGASLAWDTADGYAVLFGGLAESTLPNGSVSYTLENDTWTYAHGDWANRTTGQSAAPSTRWFAAMAYDELDGYVLLFGGGYGKIVGIPLSDTWMYAGGNWTRLTVTGSPTARYVAGMAYDPADNETVLFGGCTPTTCPSASTWTYANLSWTLRTPASHPSARSSPAVAYSPVAKSLLLFGGVPSGTPPVPTDLWTFSGGNWTNITPTVAGTPYAEGGAMAYDPVDGFVTLFGGDNVSSWTNATWALGPWILGHLTIVPEPIDVGQSVTVNATPLAHRGYVAYDYTELPPGCTAGNVSEFQCTPSSAGTYFVNVTLDDAHGVPSVASEQLNVSADPLVGLPVWDPVAVTAGNVSTLRVVASGGSGALHYRYTNLPGGCLSADVATLLCTPIEAGNFSVQVIVSDASGYPIVRNASLEVHAVPSFGSLVTIPSEVDVGTPFTLYANLASGTGTGPFHYTYDGLPLPCRTADVPALVCSPGTNGTSDITANVTDAFGWSAAATLQLTVNPDPAFSSASTAPAAVDVGTPVTIWANASGRSGGFSYQYAGAPPGCTMANAPENTCVPAMAGNFHIVATATDAAGYVLTETIPLLVHPALALGAIAATPASIDVGQSVTLAAQPTGGSGPFVFAFDGLPRECHPSSADGNVTCSPTLAGVYFLEATVTDATGTFRTATGSLRVNDDPTIDAFAPSANPALVGREIALTVVAANGSGPFSYAFRGLPPGCLDANVSVLECAPGSAGTYSVVVTATDSVGLTATAQVLLIVTAGGPSAFLGLPPVIGYALVGSFLAAGVVGAIFARRRMAIRRREAEPSAAS
ncbi:MAG: hypothetical protein L3J86_01535 [Thermoplasmata archaeon]|nr:hypothetical protein [Thermoplasmata archaeon]